MPKKTREEAKEILNNIEAGLLELAGADFKAEFSNDPEEKRLQQTLLYYRLCDRTFDEKKGEERAAFINTAFDRIKSGDDRFARYVLSLPAGEQRENILEELVMNGTGAAEFARIEYIVNEAANDGKEALKFFDTVSAGLFAPETDRSKLGFVYDGRHNDQLEAAQDEIDKIRLPLPEGFDPEVGAEIVTQAVLGSYLSDDIMERSYAAEMNIRTGSTLKDTVDFASGGMSIFFENMSGNSSDKRTNMQMGRLFVAEARNRTAEALKAYSEGNRKPLADALMNGFNKCLNISRYTSHLTDAAFRNASRSAVEIYNTLSRPEFKNVVEFTPEQKRWADVLENEIKLNEEYDRLKQSVYQTVRDNYGKPGKPSDDFNTWRSMKRMMEINMYRLSVTKQTDDIRNAMRSGEISEKENDRRVSSRGIYRIEALMLDNPEAYGEYLSEKVSSSAQFAEFESLESWDDMHQKLQMGMKPDLGAKSFAISENENLAMTGKFRRALSLLPNDYEELRERLGNASCLKDSNFPANPGPEQLKERLSEYRKLDSFMRSEGYYGVKVEAAAEDDPDEVYIVAIGSELQAAIEGEIKALETAIQPDPVEAAMEKNIQIENFIGSLKENFDKNGQSHFLFSRKGEGIGFTDAYEALKKGDTIRLDTFNQRNYLGIGQTLKFDPKQMKVVIKGEKLTSREISIADGVKEIPSQIKKLKEVQEVLRVSNPFFVSNSTAFNDAMKSLDTLVDAQQRIGENPNVRQVNTLLELYGDLEKKVTTYVEKKGKALKPGDDRGKLRYDVMKSLKSVINREYVTEMADFHYPERFQMKQQSETAAPTVGLMQKWNTAAAAAKDPAAFCSAFDKVLAFAKEQDKSVFDRKYVRLAMSVDFGKLFEQRMHLAKTGKAPELAGYDQDFAKSFEASCEKAAADFARLDSRITLGMQPAAPKAEIGSPAGEKDPEIEAIKHPDLSVPGM